MKILLVEYDPEWPARFEREASRIRSALGSRALRVEHAGSTAVPGLAAKPIIDIVLAVEDSAREPDYAPALGTAGYRLQIREPGWHEHRMFRGMDPDVNLHVFSTGCSEIGRMLRFRDWLRSNESDRELYSREKRALAEKEWADIQSYADAKAAVVQEIVARAQAAADRRQLRIPLPSTMAI